MKKKGTKSYNLNARGKIGSKVEVYAAFEYDVVPSCLGANLGDYVHIQFSVAIQMIMGMIITR